MDSTDLEEALVRPVEDTPESGGSPLIAGEALGLGGEDDLQFLLNMQCDGGHGRTHDGSGRVARG